MQGFVKLYKHIHIDPPIGDSEHLHIRCFSLGMGVYRLGGETQVTQIQSLFPFLSPFVKN